MLSPGQVTGAQSASCAGTSSQRPSALHCWHRPSHAASQHTWLPSARETQKSEPQSAFVPHASPSAAVPGTTHSPSPSQAPRPPRQGVPAGSSSGVQVTSERQLPNASQFKASWASSYPRHSVRIPQERASQLGSPAAGPQVPSLPGAAQVAQRSVQGASQHTPSTQKPDTHSPAAMQSSPRTRVGSARCTGASPSEPNPPPKSPSAPVGPGGVAASDEGPPGAAAAGSSAASPSLTDPKFRCLPSQAAATRATLAKRNTQTAQRLLPILMTRLVLVPRHVAPAHTTIHRATWSLQQQV